MNAIEYMKVFNEIENDFPVDKWKINNIHVWPYIRVQIAYNIDDKINRENQGFYKKNVRFWSKIFNLPGKVLKKLIRIIEKVTVILTYSLTEKKTNQAKADLLFLSVSSTRTFLIDKWFNIQSDPFLAHLENSDINCLVLEYDNGVGFRKPIFFKHKHINFDKYFEYYLWKNKAIVSSRGDIQLEKYDEFRSFMKKRFSSHNLEGIIDIDKLTQRANHIKRLSNLFKQIIKNNSVKICFITNYDNINGMALCYTCHELDIPSVELQHGVQGDLHFAYGRWLNVPREGYNTLPSVFWTWSREQQHFIDKWAKGISTKHRAFWGGNPWVEMWKGKDNKLTQYYSHKINKIKNNDPDSIYILYTLQPLEGDILPDNIVEAYRNSPPNWRWWFRLHPRQLKRSSKIIQHLQEELKIPGSDIKLVSELPLPIILNYAHAHVTQVSSAILEAEIFNVPSVFTHPIGATVYEQQIQKGIAIYCDEKKDDLNECIAQQLKFKPDTSDTVDAFEQFDGILHEYGVA